MPTVDESISKACEILRAEIPEAIAIYIFGSQAFGRSNQESDLDVAALGAERVPADRIRRASAALMLGTDFPGIDLIDLQSAPLTLAMEIIRDGSLRLDADPSRRAAVETRLMSMYAQLNFERSGQIADIVQRGRVYAR